MMSKGRFGLPLTADSVPAVYACVEALDLPNSIQLSVIAESTSEEQQI